MPNRKKTTSTPKARSNSTQVNKTRRKRPSKTKIKEKDININITLDVKDSTQGHSNRNLKDRETNLNVSKDTSETRSDNVKKRFSKRNKLKSVETQDKPRISKGESENISGFSDKNSDKNSLNKTEDKRTEKDKLSEKEEAAKSDSNKAEIQKYESKAKEFKGKNPITETSFGSTPKTKVAIKRMSSSESNTNSKSKILKEDILKTNNSILNIDCKVSPLTTTVNTRDPVDNFAVKPSIKAGTVFDKMSEKVFKKENELNMKAQDNVKECKSETPKSDTKIGKTASKDKKNVEMNEYGTTKEVDGGKGINRPTEYKSENKSHLLDNIQNPENAKSDSKMENTNLLGKGSTELSQYSAMSSEKCDCGKSSNLSVLTLAKNCDICSKKFDGKNKSNSHKRLRGLDDNHLFGTPKTKIRKE